MKSNFFVIILFLCLCLTTGTHGQTYIDFDSNAPVNLFGTWYRAYSNFISDTLSFTRTSKNGYDFGQRVEINKNGVFADIYTAPCGNDESIHHTKGHWFFDSSTNIFKTSILICNKDSIYKIVKLNIDSLVLVVP